MCHKYVELFVKCRLPHMIREDVPENYSGKSEKLKTFQ